MPFIEELSAALLDAITFKFNENHDELGRFASGGGESSNGDSSLSSSDLEAKGYIPVFRGVGERGLNNIRPSSTGELGSGIYFYRSPKDAAAYANKGGGIITAYVHPSKVSISTNRYGSDIVVAKSLSDVIRRGNIPTSETLDFTKLNHISKLALEKKNP